MVQDTWHLIIPIQRTPTPKKRAPYFSDFDVQYFSIFAPFLIEIYKKIQNMKFHIYIIMQARMHMQMRPYIVGAQPDMYACEPMEDGVQDSLSRTAYISYMNAF